MYFAIDEGTKEFVRDDGLRLSTGQFKKLFLGTDKPIDMTLSCQRLVRYNYDWDKLEKFYAEN